MTSLQLINNNSLKSHTNQSYSLFYQNINRLNQSILDISFKNQPAQKDILVQFEEFSDLQGKIKKQPQLSIRINDNYNRGGIVIDIPGIRNTKKNSFQKKQRLDLQTIDHQDKIQLTGKSILRNQNECQRNTALEYKQQKIQQLTIKIMQLERKLNFFEDSNRKLLNENESLRKQNDQLILKHGQLKQIFIKMDETINSQKEVIQQLNKKIQNQEKYKESLKSKQILKRFDKLIIMNKALEKQNKDYLAKISLLQRQLQIYLGNHFNMIQTKSRFKETFSNKQNLEDLNFRKSLEPSKKLQQQKKQRLSTNPNGFQKKTKSVTFINKVRHS